MTMIGSEFHPDQFQSHAMAIETPKTNGYVAAEVVVDTVDGVMPDVIDVAGQQYAKLPEGWPAAEDKDLEEAYAKAVEAGQFDQDEPTDDEIMSIYASFTPAEVRELCEDWSRLALENRALRKGMKTMQRKTRKQNQQQRRLERRLSQARAGRDRAQATASHYFSASLRRGIEEMKQGKTVEL